MLATLKTRLSRGSSVWSMSQYRTANGGPKVAYPRLTADCRMAPPAGVRTVVKAANATPRAALFCTVAYSWSAELLSVEVPSTLGQRHP
jgi:hypothetical protein